MALFFKKLFFFSYSKPMDLILLLIIIIPLTLVDVVLKKSQLPLL